MLTTTQYSASPTYTPKPKGGGIVGAVGTASTALGILQGIVPKEIINNTIGAALKHGLDCWGASVNPDIASRNISEWVPPLKDAAEYAIRASDSELEKRINDWYVLFYNTGTKHRDWMGNGARDCTLEGIELEMEALDMVKAEVTAAFEQEVADRGHSMYSIGTKTVVVPAKASIDQRETTWQVEQYKIDLSPKTALEKIGGTVSGSNNGGVVPLLMMGLGLFVFRKKLFR
ncbi:hypothetical protein [Muricauda sp. MAR_2010_75]|uniref:hypothetical protein n=1 Tax=Allomuricauda sp. MAR_2010_75 TaxID=1250232 RepID=UPI0005651184|nr:hypothetical protein [Muricauda sp. MAR_2010_75]